MYDIIELKSKSFEELLAIAEKLDISKPKSYSQDDLVYKILDEQAIKAAEQPIEKPKRRRRMKPMNQKKILPHLNRMLLRKEGVRRLKNNRIQIMLQ